VLRVVTSSSALRTALKLAALQGAVFASHGFFLPFFPLWLQSRGLSPELIGITVALPIVVRSLFSAPVLSLSDAGADLRKIIYVLFAIQVVGYPILYWTDSTGGILLLVALIAVGQTTVMPAVDLVTTIEVQRTPRLNYARIRGVGSATFLVANIAAGYLIRPLGPDSLLWALGLIPLVGIAVATVTVRRGEVPHSASQEKKAAPRLPAVLCVVIAAAALTQASHGALNAFASMNWQSKGFADSTIGYLWAVGVASEIVVFVLVGGLGGGGSRWLQLIMIGSVFTLIRFMGMAFNTSPALAFVLQGLHGFTFAFSHIGAMVALTTLAPVGARGRAQGIYGSLTAVVMATAMFGSGFIYQKFGALAFAAMAPLGVAGFALCLVTARMLRSYPQSAASGG
jgi:PPP family 3-phenylpropionic acid transporter